MKSLERREEEDYKLWNFTVLLMGTGRVRLGEHVGGISSTGVEHKSGYGSVCDMGTLFPNKT